jgi:hypothetical protein
LDEASSSDDHDYDLEVFGLTQSPDWDHTVASLDQGQALDPNVVSRVWDHMVTLC